MIGNSTSFNCPKIKTAVNRLKHKKVIESFLCDLQSVEQQEITILAVINLVNLANEIQDKKLVNILFDDFKSHKKNEDEIVESINTLKKHIMSLCTNLDNSYRNRIRKSTRINTIYISDVEGKTTLAPSNWILAGPNNPEIDKEVKEIIKSHTEAIRSCMEIVKNQCQLSLCN